MISTLLEGAALVAGGALVGVLGARWLKGALRPSNTFTSAVMLERVRHLGRLVSLQVCAKEIATSQDGLDWLPEVILSKRKLAVIFHFEKEYFVDLARVRPEDVQTLGERRYRLALPPIEGVERLVNIEPYDVQPGKLFLLLDVLPANASAQRELTERAKEQAAALFRRYEPRYAAEARTSAERQIKALLQMFDVQTEVTWREDPAELATRAAPG